MRLKPAWSIFLIPLAVALAGYLVLYSIDARLRTRRGAWQVTFFRAPDGTPALGIAQAGSGLSNVVVRFAGETLTQASAASLPTTVSFDRPLKAVPFGQTAFDDLMYLPGTVVLQCFGHEVQMLPRTLYLNRKEHAWRSGDVIELTASNKLPSLDPSRKRR